MHVVRHQTVRKNCKPFSPRRATKMPRYHRCGSFAAEVLEPTIRAKRQEITVRSAIVEAGKTGEAGHDCAQIVAIAVPLVSWRVHGSMRKTLAVGPAPRTPRCERPLPWDPPTQSVRGPG